MRNKEIQGAAPWFEGEKNEIIHEISEVLNSGQLVNGKHLRRFETELKKMTNTEYALAVNSGGTALELALLALDVKNKEVILPSQTFIASANAITRAGGIPIFADIDKNTNCLDPHDVQKRINDNTAGVMFVHMFGLLPPALLEIKKICSARGIFLIEDAAHAHGASLNGQMAGSIGDVGCFSFFATKIITTGEGGAITTNRKDIFEKVRSLHNHGRSPEGPLFEMVGNNFRLPEISCILGVHQLKRLKQILIHRKKIAKIYFHGLTNIKQITPLNQLQKSSNSYWRFPAHLSENINREEFQKEMMDNYKIRITWMYEPLCHQQPVSGGKNIISLPNSEWSIKHLINLPTHMNVSESDAHYILSSISETLSIMSL
jgi:perosamine synthetase